MAFSADPNNIVPIMTSNSDPSPWVASATEEDTATYAAYKAFNHSSRGTFHGKQANQYLKVGQATNYYNVSSYKITANGTGMYPPINWTFQYSMDGTNWTVADTQSSVSWSGGVETKIFTLATAITGKYFKLSITSQPSNYTVIYEFEIIGSQSYLNLNEINNAFNKVDHAWKITP